MANHFPKDLDYLKNLHLPSEQVSALQSQIRDFKALNKRFTEATVLDKKYKVYREKREAEGNLLTSPCMYVL